MVLEPILLQIDKGNEVRHDAWALRTNVFCIGCDAGYSLMSVQTRKHSRCTDAASHAVL